MLITVATCVYQQSPVGYKLMNTVCYARHVKQQNASGNNLILKQVKYVIMHIV